MIGDKEPINLQTNVPSRLLEVYVNFLKNPKVRFIEGISIIFRRLEID